MWQSFKNLCQQTIKDHVPTKFTSSRFNQPWVNRKVICLSRKKKRQRKKARKSGKERDWSRYRSLLKLQKQECRRAYNSYVQNVISEELKNKPRKFWQFIKSKKCDSVGVSPLRSDNGLTYTDSRLKANILIGAFKPAFNVEQNLDIPNVGQSNVPCIQDTEIKVEGVLKLLSNLDSHKAAGPDEISSMILKDYATYLAPLLAKIYQASLNTATIPNDWRKANVTPIFKKGDRTCSVNYRPISLTVEMYLVIFAE